MSVPIQGSIVTATPDTAGYPTISGSTDSGGNAVLPLITTIQYTLKFTGTSIGTHSNFIPANTTFTLYKLKNKGTLNISVAGQKLSAGKSVAAVAQNHNVQPTTPAAGSWQPSGLFTAPTQSKTELVMPTSDQSISYATTVGINILYAIDGTAPGQLATNRQYDPTVNSWKARTSDTVARGLAVAAAVGNKVYVVDGINGSSYFGSNHAYDASTDTWSTKNNDPAPRTYLVAGAVNSIVYAIDGYYSVGATSKLNYAYDPTTNSWTQKASDIIGRKELAAAVAAGKVYTFDGTSTGAPNKSALNRAYDPGTNTWSQNNDDPTGRVYLVAGLVNDVLHTIDGLGTAGLQNTNNAFYRSVNSWQTRAGDLVSRYSGGAGTIGSKLYVVYGSQVGATPLNQNNAYDGATNTWSTRQHDTFFTADRIYPAVAVATVKSLPP